MDLHLVVTISILLSKISKPKRRAIKLEKKRLKLSLKSKLSKKAIFHLLVNTMILKLIEFSTKELNLINDSNKLIFTEFI